MVQPRRLAYSRRARICSGMVRAGLAHAQQNGKRLGRPGWDDGHMHEFSIGQRRIGRPDPEDRLMGMPSVENERTVRLSGILGRVGSKAIYTYDFGDSWEHGIVLEKRLPVEHNITYPVCIDGQLACPPEDCGGIPGFYDLVEALKRSQPRTPRGNARLDRRF